jgi:large subunit ribosomal protein L25
MAVVFKAQARREAGSRSARRLRAQGLIPGIIYGHQQDPQPVTLNEHEVELALQHGERLLEVRLGRKKHNVLIKDVQYDTFGQKVLHVDLARVDLNERVEVTVPIVLRGTPAGDAEGGVLHQVLNAVSIECLVTAIPEEIRAAVGELGIGDTLYVRDLPLPDGATLLDDPDASVCTVSVVAEEVEAPAEEAPAAAEPEVVGQKPPEEPPEAGE